MNISHLGISALLCYILLNVIRPVRLVPVHPVCHLAWVAFLSVILYDCNVFQCGLYRLSHYIWSHMCNWKSNVLCSCSYILVSLPAFWIVWRDVGLFSVWIKCGTAVRILTVLWWKIWCSHSIDKNSSQDLNSFTMKWLFFLGGGGGRLVFNILGLLQGTNLPSSDAIADD